jgi:diguanylate cyclase (GGDEF)-like protein/PAS domain S-box-containing protein
MPGVAGPSQRLDGDRSAHDLDSEEVESADRRALLEAQAFQRAALDALDQGIAMSDLQGNVLLLNRKGEELLGLTAEEVTARVIAGDWVTYDEEGEVLPTDRRPNVRTLLLGESVRNEAVGWRRGDGKLRMYSVSTESITSADGERTGIVTAFHDITDRRRAERRQQIAEAALEAERARFSAMAFHDPLTGLANRPLLLDRLPQALERCRRRGSRVGVFFVDLDGFKAVNDNHGHQAGDQLLVEVARRFETIVRAHDTVARFGGDEFVILAEDLEVQEEACTIARRLNAVLEDPIELSSASVRVSASVGIAFSDEHEVDDLLLAADVALYRAKAAGKAQFVIHGVDDASA